MRTTFNKNNEIPPSAYLPPEIASNINVITNMHPNNTPMQYNQNQQNSLESLNSQFYNQQQIVVQPMLPPTKYLKHISSEPNLFGSNQQISIINAVPNQIMIRSSFSDQNFPNNNNHQPRIYQQNTIVGSDVSSITNQSYFNGSKNQMIVRSNSNSNSFTCVNNQFTPSNNFIEESPNEYEDEIIPEIVRTRNLPVEISFNRNQPKCEKISRSHSLISDDRIIDIEYDSDSGWVTKNVRPNNFMIHKGSKTDESCSEEVSKINSKIYKRNANKLGSDHRINKSLDDRDDESSEREFKISKHNFNKIINDQKSYDRACSNQRLDCSSEKLNRRKHQSKSPKRSRKSISNFRSSSDSSDVDHKSRKSLKNVVDCKKYSNRNARNYREERAIGYEKTSSSESDIDDDTFNVPFARGRNSSYHGRPNKLRLDKRRTSSLEGINSFVAKRNDPNRSSVSINETPEYFEYDKSPVTPPNNKIKAPASSIANHASNFSNSINHVALPKPKPKPGSLKKSTPNTTNKSTPKTTPKSSPKTFKKSSKKSSSEYDVSDRRRPAGNGGNTRESFRDRDQLSDRDQRDSRGSSFNRSLSNAEGTPEDKIGEFLL